MDKSHLSENEQKFLIKKNMVEWVYNASKFENLKTSLLKTEPNC